MPVIRVSSLLVACCISIMLTAPTIGQEKAEAADKPDAKKLQDSLLGAWVLAGEPGSMDDPEPGARMKFWGLGHWMITQTDPQTGKLVFHHGGTYTLDGDKYVETIKFAADSTQNMIGLTFKFNIAVDGDTYTQHGDGNSFDERWLRLREGDGEYKEDEE